MTPQNVMHAYWEQPGRVPVWSIRLQEYHGSKIVQHHQCYVRSLTRPKAIDAALARVAELQAQVASMASSCRALVPAGERVA